jgi:uncharacterized protein YndB with AHSA1/START domain
MFTQPIGCATTTTLASATMELHEADIVRRDITLDVDRETAWDAFADANGLERWFAESVDVVIREGAQGTITDHDGTVRETHVDEVSPGRRLALRWAAPGDEETLVELTLDDTQDGGTRLMVVEIPVAVARAIGTRVVTSAASIQGPTLVAA